MPAPVRYRLIPFRPRAHYFKVWLSFDDPDPRGEVLSLPAWIPGSYMIRDFARNIVGLRVVKGADPEALVPLDKQRWRVQGARGELVIEYEIYAWELSVRGAHFDQTHAFFNGTSLFLRIEGREEAPHELEIAPPPEEETSGHWKVATTLPSRKVDEDGFGQYLAHHYAHLIDCPVEMGNFQEIDFQVNGTPHRMVVSGRAWFDAQRLRGDLERICAEQTTIFGELPVKRYLFLVQVTADDYGGLEHRDSTALICARDDLPAVGMGAPDEGYRRFLGLCSHEYFHLWNVKRIRPQPLVECDLTTEAYTRQLWAFEGITSYYDDLALVRSGVIDTEAYLESLAQTVTRLMRTPGRRRQSVAESSFYAWTKFYKQDENGPNAQVSYYTKGALVALGLDVTLRLRSEDRLTLDDLMAALWKTYGKPDLSVPEDGIRRMAEALLGQSLADFFDQAVEGTDELPLQSWFQALGIGFALSPARDARDLGGVGPPDSDSPTPLVLGARTKQQGDFVQVTHVLEAGPAQACGLAPGDLLISLAGIRVTQENLPKLLARARDEAPLELLAFRRDELMCFRLAPAPAPADTCRLWLLDAQQSTEEQRQRRARWLKHL